MTQLAVHSHRGTNHSMASGVPAGLISEIHLGNPRIPIVINTTHGVPENRCIPLGHPYLGPDQGQPAVTRRLSSGSASFQRSAALAPYCAALAVSPSLLWST